MRFSFLAAFLATAALTDVLLLPVPALAAYCGPASDTHAVETLSIQRTGLDRTRIMYLAVVGDFAMSDTEFKGEYSQYFVKSNGSWSFASFFPPANLPAATHQRFNAIINASPHPCTNPHFVNHPSGP